MKGKFLHLLIGILFLTFSARLHHVYKSLDAYFREDFDTTINSSFFVETSLANDQQQAPAKAAASDGEINKKNAENNDSNANESPDSERSLDDFPIDHSKDYPYSIADGDKSNIRKLSENEIKLLQDLAERRRVIDSTKEDLVLQQNVLKAAEEKLDKKMVELKELRQEVNGLIEKYNAKEDAKINSLVKIYENMKPKDAANIFNELDMKVLLEVISRMREAKVAPILSNMNLNKAREVSIEFARRKKIQLP